MGLLITHIYAYYWSHRLPRAIGKYSYLIRKGAVLILDTSQWPRLVRRSLCFSIAVILVSFVSDCCSWCPLCRRLLLICLQMFVAATFFFIVKLRVFSMYCFFAQHVWHRFAENVIHGNIFLMLCSLEETAWSLYLLFCLFHWYFWDILSNILIVIRKETIRSS